MIEDKKKLIVVILGSLAVLLLITTRAYRPMLQQNSQLKAEFSEIRNKARGLEQISEERSTTIEDRIREISGQVEKKIPLPNKALNIIDQLTNLPVPSNLSFTDINRIEPEERDGYRVSSINISSKGTLYDFLCYLEEVDKGALLLTVESLSISRGNDNEPNLLNIKVLFSGFQITKGAPSLQSFQGNFVPIEESRQAQILEPISIPQRSIDLSILKDAEIFGRKFTSESSPGTPEGVAPAEPEEKLEVKLRGIAQEGKQRVALIDDKIVKEGDEIAGAKVREISRFKVVLSKNGRDYTLELGK